MKKPFYSFVFLPLFFLLSSCSNTIYFTQDMRNTLNKSKVPIEEVQFYNSKKIVLKRNLSYDETKVARGEIKYENGEYVEEIIIPKNTPGVAVGHGNNFLNIAFENGRNRDFRFSENERSLYQLIPERIDQKNETVVYDTLVYLLEHGSNRALLKVKKNSNFNFEKKKRVVKGISVGRQ